MSTPALEPGPLSVYLRYKGGTSDKDYNIFLKQEGDGWVVHGFSGGHGQSLKLQNKTSSGPVDYEHAKKVFDQVFQEKTRKGYTEGEQGTPYNSPDLAGRISGHIPQLLNEINEDRLHELVLDDSYIMQEKKDGDRRMLRKHGGEIDGINRKGLVVPITQEIEDALRGAPADDFVIDGEIVGDTFYCFDVLQLEGKDVRNQQFSSRHLLVKELVTQINGPIKRVRTAVTQKEKVALLHTISVEKGEGVVFKKKTSLYVPGKPHSGGDQLKWKFWGMATLRVSKINAKRSIQLVTNEGTFVGNCTIPAGKDIPKVGDHVEIRYLYAYRGGSLFTPTYLGVRVDKDRADTYDSLKFKAEGVEEDV